MTRLHMLALAGILMCFCGCDQEKTQRIEKENAELKAKVEKANAAQDFELQGKCSSAAKTWFNENWAETSREKTTVLLNFTNHFNKV